jgi:YidC/Oxa1 family membrane protein insertase
MDRRTLVLVVALLLLFLFYQPLLKLAGLGRYLEPPRRPIPAAVDTASRDTASLRAAAPIPTNPAAVPPASGPGGAEITSLPIAAAAGALDQTYSIETPLYRAVFSNLGARLLTVELKRFVSAHGVSAKGGKPLRVKHGQEVPSGDRVVLAGGPLMGLDLGSGGALKPLSNVVYAATESTDARGMTQALTFVARDSSGFYLRQTWRVRPGTYALDLEVETRGIPDAWRVNDYSLVMRSWPAFTETDRKTDLRSVGVASLVGRNLHRDNVQGLLKGPKAYDGAAEWAAVQSRYFIAAAAVVKGIPRGAVAGAEERPVTEAMQKVLDPNEKPVQPVAVSQLVVGLPSGERPVQSFLIYLGPSDIKLLGRFGRGLEKSVYLGWNWMRPISELLLWLLDWVFVAVRNYGLAIFGLAVLVRLVLHPLNTASLKSMRAMQQLQPEVERLRVKYKSDAQTMNTALMALYKENKVNPAGGCLPLVLQMPILMALYQVLLNAIELRQAPFVGWIYDLSAPDVLFTVAAFPVHLLPVLMALSGFLLQKFTPTNPQQAPMQYMMNAFMVVLFYNLPSGLVFYWTVMNLLSALQQWMVLRQDGPAVVVVPAGGKK